MSLSGIYSIVTTSAIQNNVQLTLWKFETHWHKFKFILKEDIYVLSQETSGKIHNNLDYRKQTTKTNKFKWLLRTFKWFLASAFFSPIAHITLKWERIKHRSKLWITHSSIIKLQQLLQEQNVNSNYLIEFPQTYDPQDSHINLVMSRAWGKSVRK